MQGILRFSWKQEKIIYDISVYFKTTEISPRSHVQLGSASDIWRNQSTDLERSPMKFLRVPLSQKFQLNLNNRLDISKSRGD